MFIHSALAFSVLHNLAVNYRQSGQIEKAIKAYEEVMEIKEGDQETPTLSLSVCKSSTLMSVLKYQSILCTDLLLE